MNASILRRRSVRWRLPLSYAGIALLTAITLSVVLLSTVRNYYRQIEQEHLRANAEAIAATAEQLDIQSLSAEQLDSLARVFSFLAQTRVQFLADDGTPVADSGIPTALELAFRTDGTSQAIASTAPHSWMNQSIADEQTLAQSRPTSSLSDIGFVLSELEEELTCTMPDLAFDELIVPARGTLFGFGFDPAAVDNERRSSEQLQVAIVDTGGATWGSVQLSNGPSYGMQIVQSIASHLLAASLFAIALAALAGWYVSQQISKPLSLLTAGADQMAHGQLATRVDLTRADEFGLLAQRFNEMATQIEETVKMLRRFVADAAHAMYTPLTALRTTLEVFDHQTDHATQSGNIPNAHTSAAMLQRAQGQVQQLITLTDDLLALSKIEAENLGSQCQSPQPICLTTLVQQHGERYASQADQAEIDLCLDIPDAPITILGTEQQIICAIDNLVENALKFTPVDGQVTIGLRVEPSSDESSEQQAVLWVADTGVGVDETDIPRLTERFFRGRSTSAQPGSGLGLAIVAAIMENHDGTVEIHRTEDGTQVSLTFAFIT